MARRAPITIPNAGMLGAADGGAVGSPMPWADDYAAPTPSFPLTPQAQQDRQNAARKAQLAAAQQQRAAETAQHEAQQRAAVLLQSLCRSQSARAGLAAAQSARAAGLAALADAQQSASADAAATLLQAVCRAHLVCQLRAWFTASATRASPPAVDETAAPTAVAGSGGPGSRRRDAQRANRAAQRRASANGRPRNGRGRGSQLEAQLGEIKGRVHDLAMTQTSEEEVSELTQRIRKLEMQLGRGLGQPESAARQPRRRRRPRARAPVDLSSSSLRVKARPTVAVSMSVADVHSHSHSHSRSKPAPGGRKRHAVARSKSVSALGSSSALEEFSAEWSQGSVDGWSQWLPRHRWFQGLAGQLHALHSLADPLAGADDDTRSYIRDYVGRELSHPHRTSGHRMDSGNAVESAVAHGSAWKPGSGTISSLREFGAPPELPGRVAPTVPARSEHWVDRLSRRSTGGVPQATVSATGSTLGTAATAGAMPHERLQVILRKDVGGTTGFGIVLQCDPSSSQDRRLQPPSQTVVTAVTPGSDASAAGIVAGMAVLSVNGNELLPDTTAATINAIFEHIVSMDEVPFEFEQKGFSGLSDSAVSIKRQSQSVNGGGPEGWCARARSTLSAAGLGKQEAMVLVLWDGGGTAHTAASAMCEHAAHQLTDVLARCFRSGLVREVACVAMNDQVSDSLEESTSMPGQMWTREADELLTRMVPEHTSPTGGRIAWSSLAAKLSGWSQSLAYPVVYSGRGCQDRWDEVLDPHLRRWESLRPPKFSVWWCSSGVGADDPGSDDIVPEQLYMHVHSNHADAEWPSEDEVVSLVGARIHDHLGDVEQDTEDVVLALHKQVRLQMRSRHEVHTEIEAWQSKNKELERKLAFIAASELASSQDLPKGTVETIYSAIIPNPLRPCAAPSRACTPGGAAAEDLVPGQNDETQRMLPITDVGPVPMPVLLSQRGPSPQSELRHTPGARGVSNCESADTIP
jgi:hypothetical protein